MLFLRSNARVASRGVKVLTAAGLTVTGLFGFSIAQSSSQTSDSPTFPSRIVTNLNFPKSSDRPGHPRLNKTGVPNPEIETTSVDVLPTTIHNARCQEPFKLAVNGFELQRHALPDIDFSDEEQIQAVYYPEALRIVKEATGAEHVVLFDHTIRHVDAESPDTGAEASGLVKKGGVSTAGVTRVHGDYTDASGKRRILALAQNGSYTSNGPLISKELAREAVEGKRRCSIVNIWRSIDTQHPIARTPLACLDCATVIPADYFTVFLHFFDRIGQNMGLIANSAHKWYHFPAMTSDETLLFKTYESDERFQARYTMHTAFQDPATLPSAPTRKSIEVRVVAVFPKKD